MSVPKTVWITGGGSGIGKALALSFAQEGWTVVISGRRSEILDAASALHPNIAALPCDVTDPQIVATCLNDIGPVDLAILNAGTYHPGPTSETSLADFHHMMAINYFGCLHCLQNLLPPMRQRGGHIAIVASLAAYRGLPNASGYGPSKAAVLSLCESLRAELQESPVKIQVINPGFVQSDLTDKNDFTMPYLLTPEQAAKAIRKGLTKDHFEIAFPAPFVRRIAFLRLLPYRLYFALTRKMVRS